MIIFRLFLLFLLFLPVKSFADFVFYDSVAGGPRGANVCGAEATSFNALLPPIEFTPTGYYYYVCRDQGTTNNINKMGLVLYYPLRTPKEDAPTSFYYSCMPPNTIESQPSVYDGLNFSNTCKIPLTCTPPQVLNSDQTACVNPTPPTCTAPQVLNSDQTACVNPPDSGSGESGTGGTGTGDSGSGGTGTGDSGSGGTGTGDSGSGGTGTGGSGSGGTGTGDSGSGGAVNDCPFGQHRETIGTNEFGGIMTACIADSCPSGQIYEPNIGICLNPDDFPCMDGQQKVNGVCPDPVCPSGQYRNEFGNCVDVAQIDCGGGVFVSPPFSCPPEVSTNPPPSCPFGQTHGYYNGQFICVPSSYHGTGSSSSTSSGSGSSGSTSNTTGGTGTSGTGTGTGGSGTTTTITGNGTSNVTVNVAPNCPDCAKETTQQGIKTGIDGIKTGIDGLKGTGNQKTLTKKSDGYFGSDADNALAEAKSAFSSKWSEIKGSLSNLLPSITSTPPDALPSFSLGTVYGEELTVDFNDFSGSLAVLSSVFYFLALLISLSIIFGK